MSLRLLVDEDTQSRWLVRLLRDAGHDVATVNDLGLQGRPDPDVLARAVAEKRVVLTRNVDDFRELHLADSDHPGIAGIFFDREPSKDLSHADVVRALANLEAAEVEIAGSFHSLNAWNW